MGNSNCNDRREILCKNLEVDFIKTAVFGVEAVYTIPQWSLGNRVAFT